MAVRLSRLSLCVKLQGSLQRERERKEERIPDRQQRCLWVLPALALSFHTGVFRSLLQRLGRYHLRPTP